MTLFLCWMLHSISRVMYWIVAGHLINQPVLWTVGFVPKEDEFSEYPDSLRHCITKETPVVENFEQLIFYRDYFWFLKNVHLCDKKSLRCDKCNVTYEHTFALSNNFSFLYHIELNLRTLDTDNIVSSKSRLFAAAMQNAKLDLRLSWRR